MESSDDECETVPRDVSDYEFISGEDEPISFAELPVHWIKGSTVDEKRILVFLHGTTDNGIRKLYKEVIAWKFDLSCKKPEISVLSVEGHWIKLLKPRKAFEDIIRTILITLHFLHLVKSNPQISNNALWDHLAKTFSVFDTRPSEDDLVDHMDLIREAVKREEPLAISKLMSAILEKKLRKRKSFHEDTKPFIVDDENEDQKSDKADEDGSDQDDCFDSVCAFCDNGGHIFLCEGKCMRSFHPKEEDGEDSYCETLGFTREEEEAMRNIDFYCKNCEYKQHQCFACGELGSSDESTGAEVFCCINGACGHFYHPGCVAQLLHPNDKAAAEEHSRKIATGEQFACPVHRCCVCNELEVKSNHELQFAICRRCPRAYHRKCLPSGIAFEEAVDEGRATIQRAWEENLLPNRILIYCLKHKIDEDISTPARNHIKFPGPRNKRKLIIESSKKDLSKDRNYAKPLKTVGKVFSSSKISDISQNRAEKLPAKGPSKKQKVAINRNSVGSLNKSAPEINNSLGDRLFAAYGLDSESANCNLADRVGEEHEKVQNIMPTSKRINNAVTLDDDARDRILNLMKEASSSITLAEIKSRHKTPSTHSSRFHAENISMGKVEGSIQALRTALEKLEKGGSIQDAKAVCGNDLLVQVMRWKEKLKVYLAPFLYGMRYTSFGRHFTNTDKLKGIVDMLHCYMQDGDMLVDFCCGSNDFSCFMKTKLEEVGKKCSFKNYDILQAKNDFCFERRDWMEVELKELPKGSQLIMGLNPPFGVNAALANKFIKQALKFKPKLLILIVPRETLRLDEIKSPYDLIWEDTQMLAGKSFYLPGSIDVNDKQIEDWNVNPPVLYLWSSPDWTPKHKAIAEQHGHPGSHKNYKSEECTQVMPVPNQNKKCNNLDESQNEVEEKDSDVQENQEQCPMVSKKCKDSSPIDTEENNNHGQSSNDSEVSAKDSGEKRKKKRKISSNKKVVEDKSSDKKVVEDQSSNKNAVDYKLSDKKFLENKSSDKKIVEEDKSSNKMVVEDKSANKLIEDKSSNTKVMEDKSSDKKVLEDKSANKKVGGEKSSNKKVVEEDKSSNKKVVGEKFTNKKGMEDKSSNKKAMEDKSSNKKAMEDKSVNKKVMEEKSVNKKVIEGKSSNKVVEDNSKHSVSRHSSPRVFNRSSFDKYSSRNRETQSHMHSSRDNLQRFDHRSSGTYHENSVDDLVTKYAFKGEESSPSMASIYSRSPNPDYSYRALTERNMGYPEERTTVLTHRSYTTEMNHNNGRIEHLSRPATGFLSSYGQLNPAANSTYGGTASFVMQRYAPHLDEVDHGRVNTAVSGPPGLDSRHGSQFGYLGFATGPYNPYSQHNSSGWLNE